MQPADLQRLFEYNYWANRKLFSVLGELTPEQFVAPIAGSYGSIRNTLVHVLSAEWGWLDRCGGPPRGERLRGEDYPTVQSLAEVWARVERDIRAFLAGLEDADLARPITFALGAGPSQTMALGDLLLHAAIHAVHHRGQVALLLREIGFVPGNFDYLMLVGESS